MEIPMTGSSIRNSHSRDGGKIPLSLERGTQWLEGPLSHDRHETIRFRETSDSNRLMQDDFLSTTSAHSKDVYCPQWTMHSHPQGNFPPHPEGKGGLAHSQHSIDHAGRPTWPAYPAPWPPLPFWGHPPHGESPISGDHDIAPRILVAPELVDRRHVLEHLQSLNSYLFAIGFLLDGQFRPGVTQLCRNIVTEGCSRGSAICFLSRDEAPSLDGFPRTSDQGVPVSAHSARHPSPRGSRCRDSFKLRLRPAVATSHVEERKGGHAIGPFIECALLHLGLMR